MSAICIIDTSVFCNILDVPNRNQRRAQSLKELRDHFDSGNTLLLPLATIYETGNHIAQQGDVRTRRRVSELFVQQVKVALEGGSPFTPTLIHRKEELSAWLSEFPDRAMAGIGFGDLSIIKLFETECARHPSRRIFIWSYDKDLQGYDRPSIL